MSQQRAAEGGRIPVRVPGSPIAGENDLPVTVGTEEVRCATATVEVVYRCGPGAWVDIQARIFDALDEVGRDCLPRSAAPPDLPSPLQEREVLTVSQETAASGRRREQMLGALDHANEIRLARARSRMAIRPLSGKEGRAQVARLIVICPDWLASEPIHLLLLWPSRMQARTVSRLMALIHAHGVRSLGSLTERQRQVLADALTSQRLQSPRAGAELAARYGIPGFVREGQHRAGEGEL